MEDTEKFIECVKKYPCLWNVVLHSYKCNTTKDNAWREVIIETGILNIKQAKDKWKKLRDCFRESIKKQKEVKSGQSQKKIRPYKYYHVMEFLLPTLENRNCSSNYPESPEINTDIEEMSFSSKNSSQNTDTVTHNDEPGSSRNMETIPQNNTQGSSQNTYENLENQNSLAQVSDENTFSVRQRGRNNEILDFLEADSRKRDAKTQERYQLMQEILKKEDPMDKFFLAMSNYAKKLPESLQLQVKRKVFNAVIEAEELNSANTWCNSFNREFNPGELADTSHENILDL